MRGVEDGSLCRMRQLFEMRNGVGVFDERDDGILGGLRESVEVDHRQDSPMRASEVAQGEHNHTG